MPDGALVGQMARIASPIDCLSMGMGAHEHDDMDLALACFGLAEAADDPRLAGVAAFCVGAVLDERGDEDGAEAAYRRGDERGDDDSAFNLGVLLRRRGDEDGAAAAYRRAEERRTAPPPP
jgi:tetratricopeptide (TPR) repeat protein